MIHKVTLIPGDGIGPEVTSAVVRILEATGIKFSWESCAVGANAYEQFKEYIPKEVYESIERTRLGKRQIVRQLIPKTDTAPTHDNTDEARLRGMAMAE